MIGIIFATLLLAQSPQCVPVRTAIQEVQTVFKNHLETLAGAEARDTLKHLLGVDRQIEILMFFEDPSDGEVVVVGFRGDGCRDGWQNNLTKEQMLIAIRKSRNGA